MLFIKEKKTIKVSGMGNRLKIIDECEIRLKIIDQ